MESVTTYFGNIKDAVTSIFEGLAVTASHLIRKPYTVQYPDRVPVRIQDTLPFRYRGILEVDMDICTGCLACERACPIDCIIIVAEKDKQTKQMLISQFDIDIAKCTARCITRNTCTWRCRYRIAKSASAWFACPSRPR